jgi:hypothetical protein
LRRVLLEKLIVTQLVKKFPTFYGTRRFITKFTRARHRSIPWARWIQPTASNPTPLKTHSNIILRSTVRSSERSLPFRFSDHISPLPCVLHVLPILSPWLDRPNNNSWRVQVMKKITINYRGRQWSVRTMLCFQLMFSTKLVWAAVMICLQYFVTNSKIVDIEDTCCEDWMSQDCLKWHAFVLIFGPDLLETWLG